MRLMGIDYGTVRIGVSLSDSMLFTASPFTVLERVCKNDKIAVKTTIGRIKEIAEENSVSRIVIGLPKKLDNSEGMLAPEIRSFAERLEKELSLPIVFWDERFSSAQAEKALISADVSRKKRKERIDGIAAALILQSYLETLPRLGEV